jgi:glycosyltransferase involved in cell wall biosynthesis
MRAAFVMVGDRDILTGGYVFNYRMVEALRGAGHRVDVIHYRTLPPDVRDRYLRRIGYVAGELRRIDPDLLVFSKSYKVMLPLLLLGRLPDAPRLFLVHHLEWRDRGMERGPMHRRAAVRALLGASDAVWVNSISTREDLAALDAEPKMVTVIPPGFQRPDSQLPDRRGRSGPVRLLTVGSVCRRKAQIDLVRACAGLDTDSYRLVIAGGVGEEDYSRMLDEEIRSLGLAGTVERKGHLEREELYREYARADVMAQASTWEGYGIAVAEGMWMGLPVVATTGGATPEVLGDSGGGLLVDPGDVRALRDALAELVEDPDRRLVMGGLARARAQVLPGWDETGRRFVELAETVAEGGR